MDGVGDGDGTRDVPALLAAVADIGPFFAVATGPEPAGGGWVPVRALRAAAGGDDPLTARVASVRATLRTDDRVAASTVFQALAAQLVAPLLAAVAVEGRLPLPVPAAPGAATWVHDAAGRTPGTATWVHDATEGPAEGSAEFAARGIAGALRWRPGGAGPWLWWSGDGVVVACPDAAVPGAVLVALFAPLVAAVRARVSVADRVLWGDVASAVASARQLVAAARPAAAAAATAVAGHLLTRAPLAGTAVLRAPEPPDLSWTFRRRSCCLYYRVPGGDVCGDCVLRDRRTRRIASAEAERPDAPRWPHSGEGPGAGCA